MALGIDENYVFKEYSLHGWSPGSVIIICTDGVREAQNVHKEMFGIHRLREVIRKHASESAEDIQNALIKGLQAFSSDFPCGDDIAMVIVKLKSAHAGLAR